MARKLLFAALIALSAASAIAQAPPPVPALPDTERRTTYSISGTTCICAVNFALYGDSTDYQNWVEVFLNGVRVNYNDATFGWTITSPTGALASIPRPVTDGVLTFNGSQTGTVQIVGARRPRRVSQFSENRGVAARDLNQALTDIIAQNRETWDKTNDVTGRSVLGLPGETLGLLPSAASRAGKFFTFDGSGNPAVTSPGLGSGNVIGAAGTTIGHVPSYSSTAGTAIQDSGYFPVQPLTCSAKQYMSQIAGSGIPACAQPQISDLQNIPANTYLGNPTSSPGPVLAIPSVTVTPASFGAACNNSTDDTTALNAMYAASGGAASGATIQFPAIQCKATGTVAINIATTTRIPTGGGINSTAAGYGIRINVSNVSITCEAGGAINGPRTPSTGNTYLAGNSGVFVNGTNGTNLSRINVTGCTITNWQEAGIWPAFCVNCRFNNNYIDSVSYAGILCYVCNPFWIQNNYITNVSSSNGPANASLPTGTKTNAYGITATTDGSGHLSQDGVISGNTVIGVPTWECFDTHAGVNIVFDSNKGYNCRVGIQVTTDGSTIPSSQITVTNNVINCIALNQPIYPGGASSSVGGGGIVVAGVSGGSLASDIIVKGNTIAGCGSSETATAAQASITVGDAAIFQIEGNNITAGRWNGVQLYGSAIGSLKGTHFNTITAGPIGASGTTNLLIYVNTATCNCLLSGNYGTSSGSTGYYITAGNASTTGIARDNSFFNLSALYAAGGPNTNRNDLGATAP